MTSAVLDAALCLLFVSAAVVTVVDARNRAGSPEPDSFGADHAGRVSIQTLTTVTTTLTAQVPTPNRPETVEWRRRGTLAELLAVGLADDAVRSSRVTTPRTASRTASSASPTATDGRVRLTVRWWW